MGRDQYYAQIGADKTHRVIVRAGKISKKLGVTGKRVAAEKQCSLVDGRRSDRIDAARGTQFHGRLDVTGRGFSGGARLDAGLHMTLDVIEMKD